MYAIIKDSKVICIISHEPNTDDLATRGESFVDIKDAQRNIGDVYSDNTFTTPALPPPIPATSDQLLEDIRVKRDSLLVQSDKYLIPDFPITADKLIEWKTYRQQLRDLPKTVDVNNPIYPTQPGS